MQEARRDYWMMWRAACLTIVVFAALHANAPARAETIATFTRNPANPILRGVRIGSEIAARSAGAEIVH